MEGNKDIRKQLLLHARLGHVRTGPNKRRFTMGWEGGRDNGVALRGVALLQEAGNGLKRVWETEKVPVLKSQLSGIRNK